MGAFLVRLGGSRIRFLLLPIPFLPMIRTQLHLPAFVVLPFWLGQQVWYGTTEMGASGTAWWAHVGGFVFGAVVALALKLSRIEETWIRPDVDRKAEPSHGSVDRARQARLGGDVPTARQESSLPHPAGADERAPPCTGAPSGPPRVRSGPA